MSINCLDPNIKVSVITVCFNSAETIGSTIKSVSEQKFVSTQHIIKDGGSTDETISEIRKADVGGCVELIEGVDKGVYDAMNIGFTAATGDIICFLNSDDSLVDPNVLSDVVRAFEKNNADFVYGNIRMVGKDGGVKRVWKTGKIRTGVFFSQLPHPAFFVKRSVLSTLNPPFDSSYEIAADLKQQLIICGDDTRAGVHIDRELTKMSLGGKSTASLSATIAGWKESRRAFNEIHSRFGIIFLFFKVLKKLSQLRPMG